MKTLILYATYGGGHISTANAVKEALKNDYPNVQIEMIDCIEYINKIINKITTNAYSEMAKKVPKMWGRIYKGSRKGIVASFSKNSNKLLARKLYKLIQSIDPDVIISTHPFATQMCTYLKKHNKINVKLANILTDFKMHEQWLVRYDYVDLFFVSNEEMKKELILYGIPEEKIFAEGIPISSKISHKYDKEKILKEFELKENKKTILFFAGGGLGLARRNIFEFMKIFAENFKDVQIIAISGKNPKIYESFKEIVSQYNAEERIKVLEFTDKVPELMSISDIVITKPGGVTVSESLAANLPIIVINPIPGQEEENAEFLEKNEIAIWIKKDDNIKEVLEEIINNDEKLKTLKENTKKFAKPNSSKNICKIILE